MSAPEAGVPAYPPISDLVPHRPPMLQLDAMVDWAPGRCTCRLEIRAHHLFVEGGRVDGLMCIEYMAQAVAACLGYDAYRGGEGPRVGMIVACRRFEVDAEWLAVGDVFDVYAEQTGGDHALSSFETRMQRAEAGDRSGERVAAAKMTLVHGPAIEAEAAPAR